MKKVSLLIGILMAGSILFAQDKKQGKPRAEIKFEDYKERLELTDDQVEDWKDLREKYKPELKSIRSDETKSKADKMRAAADIVELQQEELANILSENQFAELQIIREEVKQNRKNRRSKGKG